MKKKNSWLFVDLVEDKIKNRGIFVIMSLMFYVYVTYRLITGFGSGNYAPATIESALGFSHIGTIGQNVSEIRLPQVKVTNVNGDALENINVTIKVIKLATNPSKKNSPI
jgi:uncharacterized membrane protein (DUF485 family)